ncbi:MAG: UDP-glucose 4-epimerase GalE [Candidatus Parcubacteria bacterium]|jgi:UDP-glucose 4-epimerase
MSGRILVTGGAGYIGSHTAWSLLDQGESVVVIDNLSEGSRELVPAGAEFVEGDVRDEALVTSIMQKYAVDTVMHFAAFVRVDESVREPEKYEENNVKGTRALLRAAHAHGVKFLVYSGSASVYGDAEENPITEEAPLKPMSPYAETKMRAEADVLSSGIRTISLRYFNPAGTDPSGRTGYRTDVVPTHLVRNAVRAALRIVPDFQLFGTDYPTPDGTCIRDFIHISDLAEAHLSVLQYLRKGGASRIFNCGSGRGFSVTEVVRTVKKVSGSDFSIVEKGRRPGDPPALVADISRIKRELNWRPKRNLEDMVRDELVWTRSRVHSKSI